MDPFTRYLPALEETMQSVIGIRPPELLYGMLHYHLGWADADFKPVTQKTGKRLRPIFLLLACEAHGGDWQAALPAAAAIELLHNFTLIHDDIEDRDRTRRGRPTLWAVWGEPQAINAGDALFALAYHSIINLQASALPSDLIVRIISHYSRAILKITEGQCLDLSFETCQEITETAYLAMIHNKTAVLIGLACELGGMIAGASEEQVIALREFGEHLGMAFQMQDDLLGLWGNPEKTGKPVGSDLRNHKKTLPILYGMAHSADFAALVTTCDTSDDAAIARGLALLEATGSREYVQAQAYRYHQAALDALARSGGSGEAQAALYELAGQLLGRNA
ncbi:MAG TPA: polyprenyl synthetase family protein [Anaerolineae bacterium]|nr:polyprenyl synthetase family protein [Anaerolineae bacterium]HQK12605.1 polyprenyl synthetase family protein [Anaerolineae bacterium]